MSKGSPISPSLMATKSAGAPKAPERADRTAETAVGADTAATASPVLGPNNVVPPTVMTGSEAIVRSLEELGVDDIFGLPGGAILPTYDRSEEHTSELQSLAYLVCRLLLEKKKKKKLYA